MRKCANCKFLVNTMQAGTSDVCRRFPPQRFSDVNAGFPFTLRNWWCGEHRFSFRKLLKRTTRDGGLTPPAASPAASPNVG